MKVPGHLICPLTREMYHDPVMIESGMTYEKSAIERHFKICAERAQEAQEEEESDFSESHFYICPFKREQVNPEIIQQNKRIKDAVDEFREDHPDAENLIAKRFSES